MRVAYLKLGYYMGPDLSINDSGFNFSDLVKIGDYYVPIFIAESNTEYSDAITTVAGNPETVVLAFQNKIGVDPNNLMSPEIYWNDTNKAYIDQFIDYLPVLANLFPEGLYSHNDKNVFIKMSDTLWANRLGRAYPSSAQYNSVYQGSSYVMVYDTSKASYDYVVFPLVTSNYSTRAFLYTTLIRMNPQTGVVDKVCAMESAFRTGTNSHYCNSKKETTNATILSYFSHAKYVDVPSTDPYDPGGGNTEPGGGDGDPDDTSVPVVIPDLPTVGGGEGVADSGLISLFNPTLTQIKSLSTFMWDSSLFDISTWQKLFTDPMDAIISLSIVPIDVPSTIAKALKVGNISTGIIMNVAAKQFIEFDCGSLDITEYWAAYLDYEPYTKFEIFLPYIGYKEISANDIMAKTISLKYHIDILSGSCVAYLECGDTVIYSWNGHCSMQIPLSAADMSTMITGILGIVSGAGTTIGGAMGGGFSVATKGAEQMASNAVNNLKPTIEKSGSIGSASGILGIQIPYLIITRPKQALPLNQNRFTGYPSFINSRLSELSGFTIVEEIHLQNIPATDDEINEIERLLKKGVIL